VLTCGIGPGHDSSDKLKACPTEAGLRPADIYGGPNGALAQLKRLEAWFAAQRDFCFYSSSVLIIYEVRLLSVSLCMAVVSHAKPINCAMHNARSILSPAKKTS